MPIQHVNRRGEVYYLHEGTTKTGKSRYFFSRKQDGRLAETIPEGYEIFEKPSAQVFLRKQRPQIISETEVALVERGIREHEDADHFLVEVDGNSIIVHLADKPKFLEELSEFGRCGLRLRSLAPQDLEKLLQYQPMMRFTLVDEETRRFTAERWCFRGRIDDWIRLFSSGDELQELVAKYCYHLGRESFFELM